MDLREIEQTLAEGNTELVALVMSDDTYDVHFVLMAGRSRATGRVIYVPDNDSYADRGIYVPGRYGYIDEVEDGGLAFTKTFDTKKSKLPTILPGTVHNIDKTERRLGIRFNPELIERHLDHEFRSVSAVYPKRERQRDEWEVISQFDVTDDSVKSIDKQIARLLRYRDTYKS